MDLSNLAVGDQVLVGHFEKKTDTLLHTHPTSVKMIDHEAGVVSLMTSGKYDLQGKRLVQNSESPILSRILDPVSDRVVIDEFTQRKDRKKRVEKFLDVALAIGHDHDDYGYYRPVTPEVKAKLIDMINRL